jgi:hypothetical protein
VSCSTSITPRWAATSSASRAIAAIDRARPRVGIGLEPALGLGDALLEELVALMQTGVADLELAAPRCQHRCTRLEIGASFAARTRGVGLGLLIGIERRERGFELGDPLALDDDVARQIAHGAVETLQLRVQLTPIPEHAGEAFRGGREAGVVLVEPAFE